MRAAARAPSRAPTHTVYLYNTHRSERAYRQVQSMTSDHKIQLLREQRLYRVQYEYTILCVYSSSSAHEAEAAYRSELWYELYSVASLRRHELLLRAHEVALQLAERSAAILQRGDTLTQLRQQLLRIGLEELTVRLVRAIGTLQREQQSTLRLRPAGHMRSVVTTERAHVLVYARAQAQNSCCTCV